MKQRQRIDKILANLGYGTRKEVKELIKNGGVEIDGMVITDPGALVDPNTTQIKVNGSSVEYKEFIYIMMNKPGGVISATEDNRERTVVDLLEEKYRIFGPAPVGRLDKDTEGLLLLTNDGQLAHKLISPKKSCSQKYFARVEGKVTEADVLEFEKGIVLDDGYKTMPGHLKILLSSSISEVEVTIYEGKFHQIKRMFKALGKEVIYLKRLSMGSLYLDSTLKLGEYRELKEAELKNLLQH